MRTVIDSYKPDETSVVVYKATGGDDVLPTSLAAKPSGSKDIASAGTGPSNITYYVDFAETAKTCDIYWYGGYVDSEEMFFIEKVEAVAEGVSGDKRSQIQLLDVLNIGWLKPYVQGSSCNVSITGAPC